MKTNYHNSNATTTVLVGLAAGLVTIAAIKLLTRPSKHLPKEGTYVSTKATGQELVPDTKIKLMFNEGQMDIHAGGNYLSGTPFSSGNQMFWNEENSTRIGCDIPVALQDAWLSAWLNKGVCIQKKQNKLIIGDKKTTIEFHKLPDRTTRQTKKTSGKEPTEKNTNKKQQKPKKSKKSKKSEKKG